MSWAGPTCGFRPLQVRRTLILQSVCLGGHLSIIASPASGCLLSGNRAAHAERAEAGGGGSGCSFVFPPGLIRWHPQHEQ